jgi:hypothetical protein
MTKNIVNTRIYKEEHDRLNTLAREISAIQNRRVGNPEVIRRMFNVPSIQDTLKKDAEMKRRFKND